MRIYQWWKDLVAGRIKTRGQLSDALQQHKREKEAPDAQFQRNMLGDMPNDTVAPLKRLFHPSQFSSEGYLRQGGRADYQQCDPRILTFTHLFVKELRRRGLPFYCHSAFRTETEQNALVKKGRSRATWPRAPHAQGKAVDIVHSLYHWNLTKQEWAWIGKIGKEVAARYKIPITWGGDWNFYDPAHWELSDWKDDIRRLPELTPIHSTPVALKKYVGLIKS